MGQYIFKRLAQTLLVLFIVSVMVFLLIHLIPGDPVYAMLGTEITPERHDQVWLEMNLDKPLIQQYFDWITGIFQGHLGYSYQFRKDVVDVIGARLPTTFYLGLLSGIFGAIIGVFFGIYTAVKRGSIGDMTLTILANIGLSAPTFWVGILLVLLFSSTLKWLPSYGFTLPWVDFEKSIRQTVLPLICMSVGGVAVYTRQARSAMLEVISQDYIRTARSKGLKEWVIIYRHALKNALIPILTLIGLTFRGTVAGSAVVESVFNIQGMGALMVQCINARDFNTIQACLLILSAFTCVCNLVIDILYAYANPNIRLS